MSLRNSIEYTIADAQGATGIGKVINVQDFRHAVISVTGDNTSDFTIKAQGSIQSNKPDFAASVSPTNAWDFVQLKDLEDESGVDGDTGVVVSSDESRLFEVNVNGLEWFSTRVTSYTSGNVTVKIRLFDNA